ncbi:MAG TPA: pyruvate kinase [Polyangiaceae bacterium]|jgi:pyruvate kinase|nr:pyruvate kinase [Polyangiaceae bacterium]
MTESLFSNRTKIVATLGPASSDEKTVSALIKAGANVFRLNCAHADHKSLAQRVHLVRKVSAKMGVPIGILADLQGPKMRIGQLKKAEPIYLAPGKSFIISTAAGVIGEAGNGRPPRVGTTYKRLSRDVKAGERVLLDDGNIELKVDKVVGTEVHTTVIYGGLLMQFKGLNLPGSKVSAPTLASKDLADLQAVLKLGVNFVALSFVRTARDVIELTRLINKAKSDAKVISKIERPEAVTNFDEILEASYAIMVARGDMGVELGPEAVPALQKRIIAQSLAASKPVITATQMLESMISNPRPTRAEASDVANAIYDGTSAIMLSAETASGKYPVRAVEIMSTIAARTEEDIFNNWQYHLNHQSRGDASAVSMATVRAAAFGALEARARLIAVFTESGATARHIAGERISTRVVAFTPSDRTMQRMALSWGIHPMKVTKKRTSQEMVEEGMSTLLRKKYAQRGDRVVVVSGSTRQSGLTNIMNVREL